MTLTDPGRFPASDAPGPGQTRVARTTVEASADGLSLCSGERRAPLHPQWLRHRSTEAGQVDPSNRQRLFTACDIDADLVVVDWSQIDDVLRIEFSDGHVAHLPVEGIEQGLGWRPDPDAPPAVEPWIGHPPQPTDVDWSGIEGPGDGDGDRDDQMLAALGAFHRYGFVVLHGVPIVPGTVAEVANRFGYLVGTNFGSIFDVRVEPDPADLAYTAVELLAHTDLPYRQPPPGIQLLHCLVNEAPGGESTLVDGLAAWEAMRSAEPELHRAMCDTEVEYRYDIGSDTVVSRGHVFEVDREGRFRGVRFNTKLDDPVAGSAAAYDAWYRGRRWLAQWLNDPANRLILRLGPGDLLLFDNHRILHGRTSFDSGAGRRHLQGCYIEHDGPDTAYRLAHRRRNGSR